MHYILVVLLVFIGAVESVRRGKLTAAGAVAGALIGFFVFAGGGWTGFFLLTTFFLLGTLATSWKRAQKSESGMAQEAGGRRHAGQVLANGGLGGLLGFLGFAFPAYTQLFLLLMAGTFSAAMADTLSSELGTVYGKNFYNILSFKKEQKGLDGVVSLEGTLLGVAGSGIIALVYALGVEWNVSFFIILIAGTTGNMIDSLLGATLERQKIIGNDLVNVANTLTGAVVTFLLWAIVT